MKITAKNCEACNLLLNTDKYQCPSCYSQELESVVLSGEGTIYSYTNIHVAPEPYTHDTPYAIVLVDLDEGLRVTARYDGEDLAIGEKVILSSIDHRTYYFQSATSVFRES